MVQQPQYYPPEEIIEVPIGPHLKRAHAASGRITTGGAAQTLVPPPEHGYEVHNPDASNDLWFSDDGSTAGPNLPGSIKVAANGGCYWTPEWMRPPGWPLSIYGAVTGQAFTVRIW